MRHIQGLDRFLAQPKWKAPPMPMSDGPVDLLALLLSQNSGSSILAVVRCDDDPSK